MGTRQQAEQSPGARLDQQEFHDFILDQGLVPLAMLRTAVMEQFVKQ